MAGAEGGTGAAAAPAAGWVGAAAAVVTEGAQGLVAGRYSPDFH